MAALSSRRTVLGAGIAAGILAAGGSPADLPVGAVPPRPTRRPTMIGVPFRAYGRVRIGVIGVGNRGMAMLPGWASVPGAVVTAVCDLRTQRATAAADRLVALGKPRPAVHAGSLRAAVELCDRDDVDLVYVATPWEFHHQHGKAALLGGKHVGVELPIATELAELWDLVDTSERTRRHLWLMENCNYGRNELAILKMAHDGLLGTLTSAQGGYLHDQRANLLSDTFYSGAWRRRWHATSIASLYPMHGLAPVAVAMDVNRGDRFTTLTATTSAAKGLADYRERFVPRGHSSWQETYINGDLVSCLISTAQGRVIRADCGLTSPRPYSRLTSLTGSRGVVEDYPERIYVESAHHGDAWGNFAQYRAEYDHWLWKKLAAEAGANGGHGGMDYVLQWRIVQQMRAGLVPDIDVYDSASWCAPVPLSAQSLRDGGRPVDVPDFTRGGWRTPRRGLDSAATEMPPL